MAKWQDDVYAAAYDAIIKRIELEVQDQFYSFSEVCESPIEYAFICELYNVLTLQSLHKFFGYSLEFWEGDGYGPSADELSHNRIIIIPQSKIGHYRVDFAIQIVSEGKLKTIVVECDGHDFHERTKEQARHDRSRDRYMTSRGYNIYRFTGSEIYADANQHALEVATVIKDVVLNG